MRSGGWLLPSAERQLDAIVQSLSIVDIEHPAQLARQMQALGRLFEGEVRWAVVASQAIDPSPPPWLLDAALARLEERVGSTAPSRWLSFVPTVEQLPPVAGEGRWLGHQEHSGLLVWHPEGKARGRDDALLAVVTSALYERCCFELRLTLGDVVDAFAEAVVESVAEPTWLVRGDSGAVLACNDAARCDPGAATNLRGALQGAVGFRVQELSSRGAPATYLVTRLSNDDLKARVDRAGASWGLSPRQQQVLTLLVGGETNRRIAERLDISPRTAETHVAEVLRRAGVPNRVALVRAFWDEP